MNDRDLVSCLIARIGSSVYWYSISVELEDFAMEEQASMDSLYA